MGSTVAAFLAHTGLKHYSKKLEENLVHTLEDLLDLEDPAELLPLTPIEEQSLLSGLVLLRRQMRPPFPLPPGKKHNFYIICNQKTAGPRPCCCCCCRPARCFRRGRTQTRV